MKTIRIATIYILSVLFLGCAKEEPGPSGGLRDTYWKPIHAKGELVGKDYTIQWDDEVDPKGGLTTVYRIGDKEYEYNMIFSGYHFYRENGKNVFSTFSIPNPSQESTPRMYYVADGTLFLETVSGGPDYSSSSSPGDMKPTGKYERLVLENIGSDRMTFAGVTYQVVSK